MAVSGVKNNKCFEPVPGIKVKEQQTLNVPANGSTSTTIQDSSITSTDNVIVTFSGSAMFGQLTASAFVQSGIAVVMLANNTDVSGTVTVNIMVI